MLAIVRPSPDTYLSYLRFTQFFFVIFSCLPIEKRPSHPPHTSRPIAPMGPIHLHLKHYLFELLNLHHLKIILSTKHIYENSIQYLIEWYINFRGRELIWYDLSIQTTTIFFKTSVPIVNISSPIYSLYIKQSYHYKLHSKFYKKIPILVGFKSPYDELYLFRQCIFLERVLHMNRVIFTNIQYLHKPIIPWQRAFNIIFNDI